MDRLTQHLQANRLACKYFIQSLKDCESALRYLRRRLSDEAIRRFGLGYAPKTGMRSCFERCNLSEVAEELGLINPVNHRFESHYAGRIMIPIVQSGWIVGFGARTLNDRTPKYINSPASPLFNKHEILYGLYQSRSRIYKKKYAVLVEGYFDVITLFMHGMGVVAACGTAFTESHSKVLSRWTKKVKIMFDGDEAGRAASKRAKGILEGDFLEADIVRLPDGMDPDEYVRGRKGKRGNDKFRANR